MGVLQGDVTLGDSTDDSIYLRGSLIGDELSAYADDFNNHIVDTDSVEEWPTDGTLKYGSFVEIDVDRTNDFELKLALIDPSADHTITFPDETGQVLTTSSQSSALTKVSTLVVGSIGVGFGDISIGDTENPQTLTVVGGVDLQRDVNLGSNSDDAITINGQITNNDLVFHDNSGINAGTVKLIVNLPATASEREFAFPTWSTDSSDIRRTLATAEDESMPNLNAVGALGSGDECHNNNGGAACRIDEGFGSIKTGDIEGIETIGDSPIISGGPLTASAQFVMSGVASVGATTGGSETISADKSVVYVEGNADEDQFTVSLPTTDMVGQTIILKNENSERIQVDTGTGTLPLEQLDEGTGAVYIYLGEVPRWVKIV